MSRCRNTIPTHISQRGNNRIAFSRFQRRQRMSRRGLAVPGQIRFLNLTHRTPPKRVNQRLA